MAQPASKVLRWSRVRRGDREIPHWRTATPLTWRIAVMHSLLIASGHQPPRTLHRGLARLRDGCNRDPLTFPSPTSSSSASSRFVATQGGAPTEHGQRLLQKDVGAGPAPESWARTSPPRASPVSFLDSQKEGCKTPGPIAIVLPGPRLPTTSASTTGLTTSTSTSAPEAHATFWDSVVAKFSHRCAPLARLHCLLLAAIGELQDPYSERPPLPRSAHLQTRMKGTGVTCKTTETSSTSIPPTSVRASAMATNTGIMTPRRPPPPMRGARSLL